VDRSREPLPTRVEDTLPLPPAYDAALDAGLADLGLTITPAARAAIDGHARLLLAWTTAINLTAIRGPASVALAHVIDSLSAVALLRQRGADRFIDLGSGGGYPGLPIAAVLPAARALLLEPVAKKAAFLSVVATATGLIGTVEAAPVRAEALAADRRHRGRWPAVTARAVGSLADLVELAFPLLAPGGTLVAWKRGDIAAELAAADRAIAALGGGTLEVLPVAVTGLAEHCLILATPRGAVPATFPRDPATRQRRPW
jgi:16S rRNA (guanine527-N7)-methyltransferase